MFYIKIEHPNKDTFTIDLSNAVAMGVAEDLGAGILHRHSRIMAEAEMLKYSLIYSAKDGYTVALRYQGAEGPDYLISTMDSI